MDAIQLSTNTRIYWFLIRKSISEFNRGYFFSVLWTLALPLLQGFVLIAIFSSVYKESLADVMTYIWPGLFLWNYFVKSTNSIGFSLDGSVIKLTTVPNILFPASKLFDDFFPLLFSFIIIFGFTLSRNLFNSWLFLGNFFLLLPAILAITLGIGLIIATLFVFFRDIQHMWTITCQIGLFISPIFIKSSFLVNSKYWFALKFNPFFYLMLIAREPLISGSLSPIEYWQIVYISSFSVLFIGIVIFQKLNRYFIHFC